MRDHGPSLSLCFLLLLSTSLTSVTYPTYADELVGGVIVGSPPDELCDVKEEGKNIHEAASDLTEAACNTAQIVNADVSGVFSSAIKAQTSDACTRGRTFLAASHRKSDFSQAGKRGVADCYTEEIIGDGIGNDDGICTKDEKYDRKLDAFGCVEDEEAGNGNLNGICEMQSKGKKKQTWETCLEVCSLPAEEPELADCSNTAHIGGTLKEAALAIEASNTQLPAMAAQLSAMRVATAAMVQAGDPADPCEQVSDVLLESMHGFIYEYLNGDRANAWWEIDDAAWNVRSVEYAANTCLDAMDTTIFGGDWPLVCAIAHIALLPIGTISDEMEILDDAITGTRVDNMSLCLEKIGEQQDAINEKLDIIMEWLSIPHGRRPGFPQKP